jgi:tetratricopeptide (TPR) repeat protein
MDLNNLAVLYYDQGRYEGALVLFERALEIVESVLGLDYPDTEIAQKGLQACIEKLE